MSNGHADSTILIMSQILADAIVMLLLLLVLLLLWLLLLLSFLWHPTDMMKSFMMPASSSELRIQEVLRRTYFWTCCNLMFPGILLFFPSLSWWEKDIHFTTILFLWWMRFYFLLFCANFQFYSLSTNFFLPPYDLLHEFHFVIFIFDQNFMELTCGCWRNLWVNLKPKAKLRCLKLLMPLTKVD